MTDIPPLHQDVLSWNCPDIDPDAGTVASPTYIGQERAVEALRTGIELYGPGFNIFVTGLTGTERALAVRDLIEEIKTRARVVQDRVFVHDFVEPRSPILLELPRGQGRHFVQDVERVYASIMTLLPHALSAPSLAQRRRAIQAEFGAREQGLFQELVTEAKENGLGLVKLSSEEGGEGPVEADIFPLLGDEPVPPEALDSLVREGKLTPEVADGLRAARDRMLSKLHGVRTKSQELSLQMAQHLEDLSRAVCKSRTTPLIEGLKMRWEAASIQDYLDAVESWILDNLQVVLAYVQASRQAGLETVRRPKELDVRLISRADTRTGESWDCPVVFESSPSMESLFGTILPLDEDGPRLSDIIEGAMLRADGGFVIVRLADVLADAELWNALKRVLKTGLLEIRAPASRIPVPTSPLKPDPIRISTKLVVIGEEGSYELLCQGDPEFKKVFKVHAQFENTMRRSDENLDLYAAAVRRIIEKEGLLPAGGSGLARLAEFGARLAGSQRRLSTRFGELADVYREASYLATKKRDDSVLRQHIRAAEDHRDDRVSLVRQRYLERVEDGTMRVDVSGARVGQINGLVVLNSAAWGYGRPSRISAQVGVGTSGIINIERESELSGPIHDKGVQILSGYLLGRFASHVPMRLSATLCFEQSYNGVDGDSASSTELYALLSALSGVPLAQGIAVTGSVDEFGGIQAVGGVNEKVEGFFDVCTKLGLDGKQGCIIPSSNVDDLMLRPEIVDAARQGSFRIWAIDSIDQGLDILTGMRAGAPDADEDCVMRRVRDRLTAFASTWREWLAAPAADPHA